MNFKPTLTKLAGLTLMLSSNLYAAPLFEAAKGTEQFKAEAQAYNLAAAKPSVENAWVYQVNANALTNTTQQLELNLAPGLTVFAHKQSASLSASGGIIWNGSISKSASHQINKNASPAQDSAMLINRNGKITGTIRTEGRLFQIRPLKSGLHMVTQINEDNMKPDHPPGAMAELEHQLTERLANQSAIVQPGQQVQQPQEQVTTLANPEIRVLVLYTPGVASEVADVPGLIDLAFAETNQGYVNSGINATVTLAHLAATSYTTSSISTDLDRLKSSTDSYMTEAHTLRDQHGADVVMLMVPDSGSSCGKAGAIGAVASSAFAVTAQDCATGYYSFGHELGHLQSARHNPETDGTTTPFAYGHGYRDPGSQWRSVMAYNCTSGCTRINWWSNPNKTRSGTPMGTTSTSHNARVLNETAATVAGFRGTGTPPPPPPTTDVLTNNVAKTSLAAAKSAQLKFTFEVPAGATNLSFNMTGGSGDADMYVRYGAAATTTAYDCRPYETGNTETCTPAIQAGTYHVMINGYAAFSGVSLTASYTEGGSNTGGTFSKISVSGSKDAWNHYAVEIPAGMASLTVNMAGGTGDADLYVQEGSQPTTSAYKCRPYKTGNTETCTIPTPAAGTWYLSIRAYSTYSGVNLDASWAP